MTALYIHSTRRNTFLMGLKYSAISDSETGVWCGNTEILCLSIGKLSEKSYLSRQNPTCPVYFYTFDTCKHSCWFMSNSVDFFLKVMSLDQWQEYVHNRSCFMVFIIWMHKTSDIVLIKLTQVLLHKWSLPKWTIYMCSQWMAGCFEIQYKLC